MIYSIRLEMERFDPFKGLFETSGCQEEIYNYIISTLVGHCIQWRKCKSIPITFQTSHFQRQAVGSLDHQIC